MSVHTRGSDNAGTSHDGANVPNPPPTPPSLAEAIEALVHATAKNARLLREMAQNNTNAQQGHRG